MRGFPIPSNENERLRELEELRINECGVSAALSELCAIASNLLGMPTAHVSLVGATDQVFVEQSGLDAVRTAREVAFCAHTIMTSKPFVVENAENDPRFSINPIVTGEPGIKSYVGVPLETSPGLRIGALCAVDKNPRSFNAKDIQTLIGLAHIAVTILNSHRMTLELDEQLEAAIALQTDMLPSASRVAQIQAHCPLDLSSYYHPRDGIGGDIWGIEVTGPQRVMIYLADFTGHGVAAALNAARLHSFVHVMWQKTGRPGPLLRKLNQRLNEVLPTGQFATMFCATVDFAMQKIEYASAGAPQQLYRASSHHPFEVITQPSLPLGILRDVVYESKARPFFEGGALILYSDGLVETPKPPKSILTPDLLRDLLNNNEQNKDAHQICQSVVGHLFSRQTIKATDDITLLIAKHRGGVAESVIDYAV
jgi:serine phosphatase RsbU (regulator of sigma subunit)